MSTINRGRWFRFSLRSVFVVTTLLCIWLAWQASIVRQRRALLTELRGAPVNVTTQAQWLAYQTGPKVPVPASKVSFVRRWFGDEAIHSFSYDPYFSNSAEESMRRARVLFTEAEFYERHPEPCHPGCFPPGTLVETSVGPRAIETLVVGDQLLAITKGRQRSSVAVQSIFVTQNRLWRVRTEAGELLTTETQPLCLATDEVRSVGQLVVGDRILTLDAGQIREVEVLDIARTNRWEQVFNVVLGNRELFVAGGYVARSKPPAQDVPTNISGWHWRPPPRERQFSSN